MKIGILTFHFGNNYGGILQCYALQQVLKSLGHDVEIINFKPSRVSILKRVVNKLKTISSFGVFFRLVFNFVHVNKKQLTKPNKANIVANKKSILAAFDRFRSIYLNISEPVNERNIAKKAATYAAIVVGSDQVWTSLFDKYPIYFLDWKPFFEGKRISYAACSAYQYVQSKRAKHLKCMLSHFNAISVRDLTTAKLVMQITGTTPEIVADPTLLYSFDEFFSEKISEPYILTYILGAEINGGHDVAIRKIKEYYGDLNVISILIPSGVNDIEKYSDTVYYDLSPDKWVHLFANATFVYTDSFHGVMFSLKFRKQFLAYYVNIIRSSRLIDLKERFSLDDVIVNTVNNIYLKQLSYHILENILSEYEKSSKDYLERIL